MCWPNSPGITVAIACTWPVVLTIGRRISPWRSKVISFVLPCYYPDKCISNYHVELGISLLLMVNGDSARRIRPCPMIMATSIITSILLISSLWCKAPKTMTWTIYQVHYTQSTPPNRPVQKPRKSNNTPNTLPNCPRTINTVST